MLFSLWYTLDEFLKNCLFHVILQVAHSTILLSERTILHPRALTLLIYLLAHYIGNSIWDMSTELCIFTIMPSTVLVHTSTLYIHIKASWSPCQYYVLLILLCFHFSSCFASTLCPRPIIGLFP